MTIQYHSNGEDDRLLKVIQGNLWVNHIVYEFEQLEINIISSNPWYRRYIQLIQGQKSSLFPSICQVDNIVCHAIGILFKRINSFDSIQLFPIV